MYSNHNYVSLRIAIVHLKHRKLVLEVISLDFTDLIKNFFGIKKKKCNDKIAFWNILSRLK